MLSYFVVFLALSGLQGIQFAQADSFDPQNHRAWHLVNDDKCGLQHPHQRIVGGEDAAIGEFPWIVQVFVNRLKAKTTVVCAGAIISEQFVLTVAHCIPSGPISGRVEAGDYNKRATKDCNSNNFCAPPIKKYVCESFIVHPEYKRGVSGRDIALIKIKDKFQFSDFIAPVCLEYGSLLLEDHTDADALMAGWGIYKVDPKTKQKTAPAVLQKITLKIRDEDTCKHDLSKVTGTPIGTHPIEIFLCAGGEPYHYTYYGDSGASLVLLETVEEDIPRYFTVGIVSATYARELPRKSPVSDIYTRVSIFLEWIMDTIAEKSGI